MDNQLPKGWAIHEMGELFDLRGGGTPDKKNSDYWNGDIPWASVKDVKSKYLDKTIDYISAKGLKESSASLAKVGELVLLTRIEPGKAAIVKNDVAVNQDCKIATPNPCVDVYWAYYLFKNLHREFIKKSSGTTVLGIRLNDVKSIPVVLPPLNEQKRIVAKIEELFSELDNGIAALKTAREQLKVYRQAVLKHAFEGKLTAQWRAENNSTSWCSGTLGELMQFITSGSRGWAKYYKDSGDIFIRAQNLKHDYLCLDEKAFVQLQDKTEGTRTQVKLGDVLITITGANVTKAGRVCSDLGTAYVSQHVALCRPSVDIDSEFMYWFVVAESAGRRQLSKFAYGAGKPGLNLDNIRSVKIDLPSKREQEEIVKQINRFISIEKRVLSQVEAELARVDLLRQSILKKAFSGLLVPQDPNDEPASELLARIKAEKEAQKAAEKAQQAAGKKPAAKRGRKLREPVQ